MARKDHSLPRVAVIGGGIAGGAAACSLDRSGYGVELFERSPELGGNAKTLRWNLEDGEVESQLLVIAWPEKYYPNCRRLISELDIETDPVVSARVARFETLREQIRRRLEGYTKMVPWRIIPGIY